MNTINNRGEPDQDKDQEPEHFAEQFSQVASGVYRVFDAELVWQALQYATAQQLFAKNPTIMLMFVRIAEVYPAARELLAKKQGDAPEELKQALDVVLSPPDELNNAGYLPESIQSPGEMDLCWAEFLVTGDTASVEPILAVLDRVDKTRAFLAEALSDGKLELNDQQRMELQHVGIGLGKLSDNGGWEVMTPGDTDLFLSLGVKDGHEVCKSVFAAMEESLRLHVACKGAAVWSLRANASMHGTIRLFCDSAAKQEGGFGRTLLAGS